MKTIFKLVAFCFLFSITSNIEAQILDLESTTDGMLVPRMTTLEKDAIVNTSQSLLVYDTDTKSFWYYEDMMWNELGVYEPPADVFTDSGDAAPEAPIIDGDLTGVSSTINLTGPGNVTAETQFEICLNITHNFLLDVDVTLTAPDGTTILDLTSDNAGVNYTNTCFRTNSIIAITAGTSPFTGSFIPEQPLSDLIGQTIAGDWILTVIDDDVEVDFGTFNSWSINFQVEDAFPTNLISDIDGDTRIQVEENADEDMIRFDVAGVETATLGPVNAQFNTTVTAPLFSGNGSLLTNLSTTLISDVDDDTRIQVEENADEDMIRFDVAGVETATLGPVNAQFNTTVTAPFFSGDGSLLTNLPSSGGGCTKYGDGSAGDLVISSNTDWSTTIPLNGNFMFNDLTINAGQTLTVFSGTVIMVANNFSNAGTIVVLPGVEGERASTHVNGAFPRLLGYTLTQFIPYPEGQLRFITNPKTKGGGSGEDGSGTIAGSTQEGGSGGGCLIIRAANALTNSGTINAIGGNAIAHSNPAHLATGAGGGGGGFVILFSPTITNTGTINVNGGNGTIPGTGDDDHAGGGGGGGLVHYIATNANAVAGTVNVAGGAPAVTPGGNLGTSGGDGGTSAGAAGLGGTDVGGFAQPTAGGVGIIIRTQVGDPCSVSYD